LIKVIFLGLGLLFAVLTLSRSAELSKNYSSEGTVAMVVYMFLAAAFLLVAAVVHILEQDSKTDRIAEMRTQVNRVSGENASKSNMATELAARLRELATRVEDLSNDFLWKIENIQIEKITNSTQVRANSHFLLGRAGFRIPYISNNSRTGKVLEIKKAWGNIAGCTDDEYVLYLSTTSAVRFYPSSKDALLFNIVWQVFSEPMNDGGHAFLEPKKHQLGERLRAAARKLEEEYSNSELPKSIVVPTVARELKRPMPAAQSSELSELDTPPSEGDSIAGYQLGKRLGGNSGQGTVYQATNIKNGSRTAAIKIFKTPDGKRLPRSQFAAWGEMFVEEAKLASNYPHVPFLLVPQDFGLYPWPWIRYPVLQGKTANGPLESSDWWNLAHDLLAGLAEIHADGRVHLDIKPDNIIIESDCAKILDFGLAAVEGMTNSSFSEALTFGTLPFASPEQLSGVVLRKLTSASDIYSAGITLYHARTGGKSPFVAFTGINNLEDLNSRRQAFLDMRKAVSLDPRYFGNEELELIVRMLQFEPGERITAAEGLNLIASKVDVEAKTHLIEEALLSVYEHKATERIQENEAGNQYQMDGPFKSWSIFENELQRILNSARPRYVVVNFMSAKGKLLNYVQAYFDYDGWRLEVSKPSGSSKDEKAAQSQKLMDLGWEAPSKEVPNFGRSIKTASSVELTNFCVDAFEQAFNLNVSNVSEIVINTQGEGHY
jgi:serine/threonine protein kinase